ncbi:MAG: hypothetical protein GXO83_03435 [Chlorobi bacterium]|nr:hypothetical protein [Chlorobiota bacterium]
MIPDTTHNNIQALARSFRPVMVLLAVTAVLLILYVFIRIRTRRKRIDRRHRYFKADR